MIEKIKLKFAELKKSVSEILKQAWINHKDKFFIFLLGCGMALTMILIVLSLAGCQSAPDRKSYSNEECFLSADCLYREEKNKDKSSCMPLITSCSDALKEQRYYNKINFCDKTKPADMTGNECRLYLNQK